MTRGCRQAYCVKKASPTLCSAWEKLGYDPIATWKSKINWYSENNHFKDMNRIDRKPTEFEWNIFPGITALGLLEKIPKLMTDLQCELWSTSKTGSSSSQCTTTLHGKQKETKGNVNTIHRQLRKYARKFPRGHWSFLGPGSE